MFNNKNFYICFFVLLFSFEANAITNEKSLNNNQKLVLYKAYDEIDNYYEVDVKEDVRKALDINNSDTIKFENIVLSIKSFYKNAKIPTENFLNTGLSKFLGVVVVLNFFSSYISSFLNLIILSYLAYCSFKSIFRYKVSSEGILENFNYKKSKISYSKLVTSKNSKDLIFYKIILLLFLFSFSLSLLS